jgi:GxxExxY protein
MDGDTDTTGTVIKAALTVHRELGPGLLESAYRTCLMKELEIVGLKVEAEVPVPVSYRGIRIECGYRLDLLVDGNLIVELKSVRTLEPLHIARSSPPSACSLTPGVAHQLQRSPAQDGLRRVILSPPLC